MYFSFEGVNRLASLTPRTGRDVSISLPEVGILTSLLISLAACTWVATCLPSTPQILLVSLGKASAGWTVLLSDPVVCPWYEGDRPQCPCFAFICGILTLQQTCRPISCSMDIAYCRRLSFPSGSKSCMSCVAVGRNSLGRFCFHSS